MRYCFIIFCFLCLPFNGITQTNTEEALAVQAYSNKEYEKANEYFKKIWSNNVNYYYPIYLNSLIAAKEFNTAEKLIKKVMNFDSHNLTYYLDLAKLYKASGEEKKVTDQYEKAVKKIEEDTRQIITLGKAFSGIGENDYALKTYMKGRSLFRATYPFFYEIAEVYLNKGDEKAMINEYLDALAYRESELQNVQSNLMNLYGGDENKISNPLLKQELIRRISKDPERLIYSDFLIWLELQQKDWEGAYVQSKSYDKRTTNDGYKLIELAAMCSTNDAFDVAQKCYEYVAAKGKENAFYETALIEGNQSEYKKLKQQLSSTQDYISLQNKIKNNLIILGKNNNTVVLIHMLGSIMAQKSNDKDGAILLLTDAIEIPRLTPSNLASLKILLADVQLLNGNVWEASLLYSQVEKAFKNDVIGQEAKFKNAKLSYYAGEFAWAKTQADVLKGATTKLIANDAMDLSIIISDAIGIDTNAAPLKLFASAELMMMQNKKEEALKVLDTIPVFFPENTLMDDILYKKAEYYEQEQDYTKALDFYTKVFTLYGEDIYGDNAMIKAALLTENSIKDSEKAKKLFEEFLTKYPGSVFVNEARKHYRSLRGDQVH